MLALLAICSCSGFLGSQSTWDLGESLMEHGHFDVEFGMFIRVFCRHSLWSFMTKRKLLWFGQGSPRRYFSLSCSPFCHWVLYAHSVVVTPSRMKEEKANSFCVKQGFPRA